MSAAGLAGEVDGCDHRRRVGARPLWSLPSLGFAGGRAAAWLVGLRRRALSLQVLYARAALELGRLLCGNEPSIVAADEFTVVAAGGTIDHGIGS